MIPTPQVLHLFCFGAQAQTAQTPLLLNLPRALLLMFPVHARLLPSCERCRVAQLSLVPTQSPLDPPAPAAPRWCPLQSSQSPPADIPVFPALPVCSPCPRCWCPSLELLVPPHLSWRSPSSNVAVLRHIPTLVSPCQVLLHPVPWPRWCPGEYRDISGVFCVPGTDTWSCVNQFLTQNPKIPLVTPGLEPGIDLLALLLLKWEGERRALPVLLLPFPLIPRP